MEKYLDIIDSIRELKSKGKRVTFVHGVFDLLHVGHIQTLQMASKLGDALIVGVDSDALVSTIKGKDRPVIPQAERVLMVSSLRFVDEAFILSPSNQELKNIDKFFGNLYKVLDIDIVASGPSNKALSITEKCKMLGIKYEKLGEQITSTSEIVNRILERK